MSNAKRVVHGQGREIIYSVYKFMKKEKERGKVIIPLNRLQERVAQATGVGVSTVKRIINEGATIAEGSSFKSPREKINKPTPKSSLDACEEEIIQKIIHNFTATQKRKPTMQAVFDAAKLEGVNFAGKIDSFRKVVKKLGFLGKKTENNSKNGQPWVPSENTRICNAHFVDEVKSNDPRNLAFNPTILSTYLSAVNKGTVSRVEWSTVGSTSTDCGQGSVQENNPGGIIEPKQIQMKTKIPTKIDFLHSHNVDTKSFMRQLGGVSLSFFEQLLSKITLGNDDHPKRYRKLQKSNRLLLFLMKLKLGIPFYDLARFFQIGTSTASRVFFDMLETLTTATSEWITWPNRGKTSPLDFHTCPDCTTIVDCIEIKCDRPQTADQNEDLHPLYKRSCFFKFLVGVTSNGFICFLSKAHGGNSRDDFVMQNSGFLNLLKPQDVIIADKSFSKMESQITERKATFMCPSSRKSLQEDVEDSYVVESSRVRIERALKKIRGFGIFKDNNVDLFPHLDKIMHICCVLANEQMPVQNEKSY